MRKLLLSGVALASLVTVSPAAAKDNTWYVGTDIGAVWPKSQNIFGAVDFTNGLVTDIPETDIGELKYKTGFDVDLIAGYDFGMFRVEGELGYKHAKAKELDLDGTFFTGINTDAGGTVIDISDLDVDEKTNVWSMPLSSELTTTSGKSSSWAGISRRRYCLNFASASVGNSMMNCSRAIEASWRMARNGSLRW